MGIPCLNPTLDWIYALTPLAKHIATPENRLNPTLDWIYALTANYNR